jgi:predicted RNase H-like HicB family nuclease
MEPGSLSQSPRPAQELAEKEKAGYHPEPLILTPMPPGPLSSRAGEGERGARYTGLVLAREAEEMIFHVTLEQAEDGWIVAECPALPGCVSQGKDEKEALENIREAIVAWLWAEDQKAVAALPKREGAPTVVVAL